MSTSKWISEKNIVLNCYKDLSDCLYICLASIKSAQEKIIILRILILLEVYILKVIVLEMLLSKILVFIV